MAPGTVVTYDLPLFLSGLTARGLTVRRFNAAPDNDAKPGLATIELSISGSAGCVLFRLYVSLTIIGTPSRTTLVPADELESQVLSIISPFVCRRKWTCRVATTRLCIEIAIYTVCSFDLRYLQVAKKVKPSPIFIELECPIFMMLVHKCSGRERRCWRWRNRF